MTNKLKQVEQLIEFGGLVSTKSLIVQEALNLLKEVEEGKAHVMRWVEHKDATPTKKDPYMLWDYCYETPILCKYDEQDDKAYSATQRDGQEFNAEHDIVQVYECDAGATTHLMTFNNNNGEIPMPKEGE